MKKTITQFALVLTLLISLKHGRAQNIETFESYTLSPNSYYQDNNGTDWNAMGGFLTFEYNWNTAWGGYWQDGAAYTNIQDTTDGTYTNLYGASSYSAHSGSNYVTLQSGAKLKVFNNSISMLNGFYVTNTTYAWKSMRDGDSFSRKFGDTTGTFSAGIYAQGEYPDWFKLVIKGYRFGVLLTDSVEFYLADYRPAGTANDYIVRNWQYVDCSSMPVCDSLYFELKSSDTGSFGMNTPGFFSMDDLSAQYVSGIKENELVSSAKVFPNPVNSSFALTLNSKNEENIYTKIYDVNGNSITENTQHLSSGPNTINFNVEDLSAGVYFIELSNNNESKKIKFVKL